MEVREINNKKIWEDFLFGCEKKSFLQSWNWGEFQKMLGNKIWRLGIYNNEQLIGVALIVKVEARRGKFLFVPHGPVIKSQCLEVRPLNIGYQISKQKVLKNLLKKLKEIAKKEKASFIRIAPIWEKTKENKEIFKALGFKTAPLHIHPELTWELNIAPSENEILMQMRKTTRYLIRQGLKNEDLKIEKSKEPKDLEVFNNLYQKTINRHHFVPFSLDYLEKEFLAFSPDNQILIFLAKYKKEYLASAVIVFWQDTAFYHQGASIQKYSKIPSSYLLQWEAIKEAKKRGCKLYNFWGISPQNAKKSHPWQGLSLFKKGFGGHEKEYIKTQDLPLSISYWLTFAFEKLRKIKRGF